MTRSTGATTLGATPPATEQDSDASAARRLARRNLIAIAAMSAVALAVLLLQSLLHGHLSGLDEYDDGVYFGASLQLIHGILPYRDFAFIQPPMVSVSLLPFAALSLATGTGAAFESARIFIDVLATANVAMVGLLVRRRSTLAVLVSTGTMAAYPAFVGSAQTVLLEPLLVFFCLAGLLCLFEGNEISTSRRRILTGGVLFGVAGATKLWAVFPFAAILLVLWRLGPRACAAWVAGGAGGFVACSAVFIIGSPSGFAQQVFVTQAIRNVGGYSSWQRLADLTGLPGLYSAVSPASTSGVVVLCMALAALVVLGLLAFALPTRRRLDGLERFTLAASLLTAAGLFFAPVYYYHYAGFEAPFIALLYGLVMARLLARFATRAPSPAARRSRGGLVGVALVTVLPLVLFCVMVWDRVEAITSAAAPRQLDAVVDHAIPAHGCVLSTNLSVLILDNRFTADTHGCPRVIDWLGQERVLARGLSQNPADARNEAMQARWMRSMRASVAMVIGAYPEWDAAVTRYVNEHFRRVANHGRGLVLYVRDR